MTFIINQICLLFIYPIMFTLFCLNGHNPVDKENMEKGMTRGRTVSEHHPLWY